MDLDQQGSAPATASAPLEGAPQVASATVDPNIQPFVVEPSATPDNGQGQASATPNLAQGDFTQGATDERARQLQAEKDRVYAQNLALQQRLDMLQQQQQQFLSQLHPQAQAPDKTTDPVGYLEFQAQLREQKLIQEFEKRQQAQLQSMLAGASEMQWKQQHPNVDIESVKAFNRMNGIADWNLDAGFKLMTMPTQVQNVARQAINQTYEQFKKSQPGASPMRGATGVSQGQIQLSYEKMAEAYAKNPGIEESWSPELRKFFWDGTNQLARQK